MRESNDDKDNLEIKHHQKRDEKKTSVTANGQVALVTVVMIGVWGIIWLMQN